jgi:hypothetical protein
MFDSAANIRTHIRRWSSVQAFEAQLPIEIGFF